jgi:hypothetical protein
LRRSSQRRGKRMSNSFRYGALTLLAAAIAWDVYGFFGWWWLFMPLLITLMVLCSTAVAKHTGMGATARWTVGWLFAGNVALGGAAGIAQLYAYNTADHQANVLVCGSFQRDNPNRNWAVHTSNGGMTLEGGFYNGRYYSHGSEKLAKSLVGKWWHVTYHGHAGLDGKPPYLTKAVYVSPGTCGT